MKGTKRGNNLGMGGNHQLLDVNCSASLDPLIAGFWVFLGSPCKGLAEIDRGFRVFFFRKHFEYIDVPHIYRPSSLEYKNLKLMFYEGIFYVLWLV